MATELIIAIISATVALVAAAITIWGQTRNARLESRLRREEAAEKRKQDALRLISKYREPLLHAAFDLQSRIFNLLELDIIDKHYLKGDERSREYVLYNTAYLIAQYFGWTELIRQEGLFLDLGEMGKTRRLNELQDQITHAWLRQDLGDCLRIFKGNQRVIGEQMIKEGNTGTNCMTYGEFLALLPNSPAAHLKYLLSDVADGIADISKSRSRLVSLQNTYIDLIDFLDPDFVRFPAHRRTKLPH